VLYLRVPAAFAILAFPYPNNHHASLLVDEEYTPTTFTENDILTRILLFFLNLCRKHHLLPGVPRTSVSRTFPLLGRRRFRLDFIS